ncbi:2-oxoglutarate and iron-dependent oxygenase domain-containing protein 2 isoform X2 [Scleropages formosus]|uniref:2-oxoglutarate and iron-dependent oxygenase domain-containing protein 2 isoform X2 n=1 Tax=Scleropages formosus TaxID=113540 RepID=UPI0008785A21|nr:2-oxoglutarate and iron-dependent oxygenase domain-containing protein 2 isoform X2 [Scleropages formosus]
MQSNEERKRRTFYTCGCFYTDNIFLEEYKLHVRFTSEIQFRQDYQSILRTLGCTTDVQLGNVLNKIEAEVGRRRQLCVKSAERAAWIKELYKPLHSHVYSLQESFLAPEFLEIVKYSCSDGATKEGLFDYIEPLAAQRVYRFPVFRKEFCRELIEELEHFEQSEAPKGRPNTMNNYGVLLNELGFDEQFLTPLREKYLQPISQLLFPDCGGHCLDSHKAFVVKYAMQEDLDLSYHYDNAEVPLSESECVEVEHHVAEGLLHRGQQMHGALRISSGQRWNLIMWMRASQERNKLCPMCGQRPRLVHAEGFADGFTDSSSTDDAQKASCVLH